MLQRVSRVQAAILYTSTCTLYTYLLPACVETGATRLIYTSTYNVVFGGQEIRNGDSSLPYLHPDQHVDHYSRTKCIAEQEVRRANGQQMKGGEVLKTCALRCAGIYGEGEQRHLPRIVVILSRHTVTCIIIRALFCVCFFSSSSRTLKQAYFDSLMAQLIAWLNSCMWTTSVMLTSRPQKPWQMGTHQWYI